MCLLIGYDGASYRSQLLDKRKSIVPVASFVLYFGTKRRWCRHRSIKECVNVPKDLDAYVNDYKIHVIEVAWLTDEQLAKFKSDFGIVANFFVQKRKNQLYRPDDSREIQHIDAVLKMLSVVTGDKEYESRLYVDQKNKEVRNMCEVAQNLIREGKELAKIEDAKNLLDILSDEEISKRICLPIEKVRELREEVMAEQ